MITTTTKLGFSGRCIGIVLMMLVFQILATAAPANLPAGYRFIGKYKLNSQLRVEEGKTMPLTISPVLYEVYSDGMEVRVYCVSAGDGKSYTSYKIYRSDGIGVATRTGELELVAGVQGVSKQGDMVRQVSVTRNGLTMVKMPPRSQRVVITRALAVSKKTTPTQTKNN